MIEIATFISFGTPGGTKICNAPGLRLNLAYYFGIEGKVGAFTWALTSKLILILQVREPMWKLLVAEFVPVM